MKQPLFSNFFSEKVSLPTKSLLEGEVRLPYQHPPEPSSFWRFSGRYICTVDESKSSSPKILVPLRFLARNPRWRPKFFKMLQIHFFCILVENLILRNIKMRNFSLGPIFSTLEPKIQDGRHNFQIVKMLQIHFFFLNQQKI